jgi:hypothetical protein
VGAASSRDLKQCMKENTVMTTVQPEGEDLRKAVKWISEERKYNPEAKSSKLIEEACLKFDLSPMDAEYLFNFLKQEKD